MKIRRMKVPGMRPDVLITMGETVFVIAGHDQLPHVQQSGYAGFTRISWEVFRIWITTGKDSHLRRTRWDQ